MSRRCPSAAPAPPELVVKTERPQLIYAGPGKGSFHALKMVWPLACRRLEGCPNINSLTPVRRTVRCSSRGDLIQCQRKTLEQTRGKIWARGCPGSRRENRPPQIPQHQSQASRGRRADPFKGTLDRKCSNPRRHNPDQTAMALLVEFRARYPQHYSLRQLCTLERRVRAWRREAVLRLMGETKSATHSHAMVVPSANPPELLTPPASDLRPSPRLKKKQE